MPCWALSQQGQIAMEDILKELQKYVDDKNPQRWAKLSSTVSYRRLELILLSEILVELQKLNTKLDNQ